MFVSNQPIRASLTSLRRRCFKSICVCVALLAGSVIVSAENLTGHVIGIADGDTLTVQAERQRVRVRINGIDAPEMRQTFGQSSRRSLSRMVFQKDVRLDCHKTDRYKRKVCKVWVQPSDCPTCGMTLDVGHAQLVAGMAWWFRE